MNRRTTVVADADDLALLADDARRAGRSLGAALGDLVAERAAVLRRDRRPRLGVFHSGGRIHAADPDVYRPEPFRG